MRHNSIISLIRLNIKRSQGRYFEVMHTEEMEAYISHYCGLMRIDISVLQKFYGVTQVAFMESKVIQRKIPR
jgi:hypothetical protein